MARVLLGNLLYPFSDEGWECECVYENMRKIAAWGKLGGMKGKDLLRANFHSAKVWGKKRHPAQQLHHNDPLVT